MTGWPEEELVAEFDKHGNPDDQYDIEAYRIGFDIYRGASLEDAMQSHGHAQQEPGSWDVKLWPNPDIPAGGEIHRPNQLN
jgi:hypothetical protein